MALRREAFLGHVKERGDDDTAAPAEHPAGAALGRGGVALPPLTLSP